MSPAPRIARAVGAALLVSVVALLPAAPGSAATKCSLAGKDRKLGPTYTTALSVTGASCVRGRSFVTAYYKCRTASGSKKGRCTRKVSGYRCTEKRFNQIATQFDAKVSCRKGSARINHSYTQFT